MLRYVSPALIALAALCAVTPSARADVKLPSILGSHMVLQRDKPLPIWGWAAPGEEVTVEFGGKTAKTKADDKGNWKVVLPAFEANSKGQTLTVSGKNKVELHDVLVGEVWIGSGQSNMEWSIAASHKAKEFIAAANHPGIRLFHVHRVQTGKPLTDFVPYAPKDKKGNPIKLAPHQRRHVWRQSSPKVVSEFSAVLYHFGLRLHKDLGVPVGLINSSWGGSPIEPWTVTEKSSGGMHNGMIAPLQPFAIRGVIWYQGESNMGQGLAYRDRQAALIAGWRRVWGQGMPFYFVQIAPWSGYRAPLALLWEGQTATLKIPHTGMVVVTDLVDNIRDIHPGNKHDVGNRLALWALAKT
jgi:sialate O-acetylesterase